MFIVVAPLVLPVLMSAQLFTCSRLFLRACASSYRGGKQMRPITIPTRQKIKKNNKFQQSTTTRRYYHGLCSSMSCCNPLCVHIHLLWVGTPEFHTIGGPQYTTQPCCSNFFFVNQHRNNSRTCFCPNTSCLSIWYIFINNCNELWQ